MLLKIWKNFGKPGLILLILLLGSNLFLLNDGLWLYQDAAYWPKTGAEAWMMFSQQFHVFTNYGYYLGFDSGLFNFTRVGISTFILIFFYLFGPGGSQAAISVLGSSVAFVAMYFMLGIFFNQKTPRFVLSLIYVFNPLNYALEGHTYYAIAIPLFIYSFYKWFEPQSKLRFWYLILNILSVFIWISYIRFVPIFAIVIIPELIYLLIKKSLQITPLKLLILIASYSMVLLPVWYSFASQLLERSPTAFNYKSIYGQGIGHESFYNAFNPFFNFTLPLYDSPRYTSLGLALSVLILWLIVTNKSKTGIGLYWLNLIVFLTGLSCFGLVTIFGESGYRFLINWLPFVLNEPRFALYITSVPLVILLGILTLNRQQYLYIYSVIFLVAGTLPLLNNSRFELRQTRLEDIPEPYHQYFINSSSEFPEASYYFSHPCWRAQYMDSSNLPTGCINFGLNYPSIIFQDPRLSFGLTYSVGGALSNNLSPDNLRITHNLKNIFVPNDIVVKKGPGSNTTRKDIDIINKGKDLFNSHPLLQLSNNENFNHYSFKDREQYDFLLYIPHSSQALRPDEISSKTLRLTDVPVIISDSANMQTPTLWYKISKDDPTRYYLKIDDIKPGGKFMLQLNQTYSDNWQLKQIDKADFESVECENKWKHYSITNNNQCLYKGLLINSDSIKDLFRISIPSLHRYGNWLNNNWLVNPDGISLTNGNQLYLIITYQKQSWYTIAVILSIGSMIVLVTATVIQLTIREINK